MGAPKHGWEDEFTPLYREVCHAELRPADGIVEALDAISWPSCIASSGTHEKMRYSLGLTGLRDRFNGRIYSATEVTNGKPAPDLFLHAAEQMGFAPKRRLPQEAAGMHVFAYAGGVTPAERLALPVPRSSTICAACRNS